MSTSSTISGSVHEYHRHSSRRWRSLVAGVAALLAYAASVDASAHEVRGKGRLFYAGGGDQPFAGVPVRLMDRDIDSDDEIDRGHTNAAGRFDLSGSASDWSWCVRCRKPDPYVKVVLDDGRIDVRSLLGATYWARTEHVQNTAGTLDFGDLEYSHNPSASLYMYGQRQYAEFTSQTGEAQVPRNGGEVDIVYPAFTAGAAFTTVDAIHWPGGSTSWRAVYHEFGHRLRHAADGGWGHFMLDVVQYQYMQHHDLDDLTNPGFAFNEGWAEYHETLLNHSVVQELEEFSDPALGDSVEGHVAYKLYLLAQACGGFPAMWRTLKGAGEGEIHSYREFLTEFTERYPDCKVPTLTITKQGKPNGKALWPVPVKLADQRRALAEQLDAIDARAVAVAPRSSIDRAELARLGPAVARPIEKLQDRRIALAQDWDRSARAAHRRLLLGVPPLTAASAGDGSHARAVQAARDEFVGELAGVRLRQIEALRREIADARKAGRDRGLATYLGQLDARYARQEGRLRAALASRGAGATDVPEDLLPPSFSVPIRRVAKK